MKPIDIHICTVLGWSISEFIFHQRSRGSADFYLWFPDIMTGLDDEDDHW